MSLTYITTCSICQQRFTTPGFEDLLKTDAGRAQIGIVMESLHKHIAESKDQKHQSAFAMAMVPSMQLGKLGVLSNFRTDDPTANHIRDYMRHMLTRGLQRSVSDENITKQVRDLKRPDGKKLPGDWHASVIGLIQQMRDILEERPPFEVKQPGAETPQSALVTA